MIASSTYLFKPLIDHFFGTYERNTKLGEHSKKICSALQIMKEGFHSEYEDKIQFLVPYPYFEYKDNKNEYVNKTFNEIAESASERNTYEFVPFHKSPEAKFQWALKHLQSYKDIKEKLEKEKKAQTKYINFYKKNNEKIAHCHLQILPEEDNPFKKELRKIMKETNYTTFKLQKSIELLYHRLDYGKLVKGKCELGY